MMSRKLLEHNSLGPGHPMEPKYPSWANAQPVVMCRRMAPFLLNSLCLLSQFLELGKWSFISCMVNSYFVSNVIKLKCISSGEVYICQQRPWTTMDAQHPAPRRTYKMAQRIHMRNEAGKNDENSQQRVLNTKPGAAFKHDC